MENEMVERVARAIYEASRGPLTGFPWGEADQRGSIREARAAIEAMREPTEGMLRASPVVGTGPDESGNWAVNTKPAQVMWPAMIDAALAPAKQPA